MSKILAGLHLSDVFMWWQAIAAMERIRVNSPGDGDVITALARLYHRVEASRPL